MEYTTLVSTRKKRKERDGSSSSEREAKFVQFWKKGKRKDRTRSTARKQTLARGIQVVSYIQANPLSLVHPGAGCFVMNAHLSLLPSTPRAGPWHIGRYPRAHHAPRFCLAEISHNALPPSLPPTVWNPSLHLPPFPFFFFFSLPLSFSLFFFLSLFPFFDSDSVAL